MPKLFELAVRNLAAATMDELQRAVFKATTDERTPPKEKHVATILRLAASGESAEHVDEALMKRLHECKSPRSAALAAKALAVIHRIALVGLCKSLHDAPPALASVCCAPDGPNTRNAQADLVVACASYLRALYVWGQAGGLRAAGEDEARPLWHAMPARDLLVALPKLQQLTTKALDCACQGGSFSQPALRALRIGVVEDALCLFRAQAHAAAALQSHLLSLHPSQLDAHGGSAASAGGDAGALALLETFAAHARRALALQTTLVGEGGGGDTSAAERPPSALLDLIRARAPWALAPMAAADAPSTSRRPLLLPTGLGPSKVAVAAFLPTAERDATDRSDRTTSRRSSEALLLGVGGGGGGGGGEE